MPLTVCFGLPGCGKTTLLTKWALLAVRSGKYKNVYANVHLSIPGVTYVPFECYGKYELRECVYFVDEAVVNCGARNFKNFTQAQIQYSVEHRHHFCELVLFSQFPDGADKILREITDRVYYVYRGIFTGFFLSSACRVPKTIIWPKGDHDGGENAGRIVLGYVKPPFWCRLFAIRIFRPRYYKYFDSWECVQLPPLPKEYQPFSAPV